MVDVSADAHSVGTGRRLDPPVRGHTADWLAPDVLGGLVRVADGAILLGSGLATAAWLGGSPARYPLLPWALALGLLLALPFCQLAGTYAERYRLDMAAQAGRVVVGWAAAVATLLALVAGTPVATPLPTGWLGAWALAGAVGLGMFRLALARRVARWRREGRLGRNTVVVGAGELGRRFVEEVRRRDRGIRLIGLFDDRRERVPAFVGSFPVLGTIEDLLVFAREHRVDEVVVALPWSAEGRLLDCLKKLRSLPCDVRLCSDLIGFHLPHRGVSHLAGLPVLNVFERPMPPAALIAKAVEDRLLAGLALLLTAPLALLIALAIKFSSPGPVLYRQPRGGFNGEVFELLKFRTMRLEACDAGTEPDLGHTRKDDPRVTPVGRWLRRTSLDELPQLWNVLRGDMSLVGPRPHACAHDDRYAALIDGYLARHRVKPGITGLAQISGCRGEIRSLAEMQRRVELDLDYIQRWSVWLDLEILLRTLRRGLRDPRAY
ncbi:MAG: undecaprenyl-phosphate glucose phosphotransferase [Geminicoccaceae bacterium]|nr:undecaprenyl-phosphate glucose phosphotransferase [Geminicoccaceae bacterium]